MDRIFDKPEDIDQTLLERVKQDFLLNNPVVVNVNGEGQRLDDEKRFILGCRAGPSVLVTNLLHEMCHLAEREKEKIIKRPINNWDFYKGKFWSLCGKSGYEPDNDKSVQRELRVWAFQLSIQNHYSIIEADEGESPAEDLVSSAVYLPAWCYYRKYDIETEKDALKRAADQITELSEKSYTFDRFCQDWEERMGALK